MIDALWPYVVVHIDLLLALILWAALSGHFYGDLLEEIRSHSKPLWWDHVLALVASVMAPPLMVMVLVFCLILGLFDIPRRLRLWWVNR